MNTSTNIEYILSQWKNNFSIKENELQTNHQDEFSEKNDCNLTITVTLKTITNIIDVLDHIKKLEYLVLLVESRGSKKSDEMYDILLTIQLPEADVKTLIFAIGRIAEVKVIQRKKHEIPKIQAIENIWFPKQVCDLDYCNHLITKYDPDLDQNHPGFDDAIYRKRREEIAQIAFNYKHGDQIPYVEYTMEEKKCWSIVYKELKKYYTCYACEEHIQNLSMLETNCSYSENDIPQLEDVSNYVKKMSGFSLRPVAGLVSARDFLASLAFKIFQCTQYVRHSKNPHHTVEPDCIHELMGHVPMLVDPDLAQFSQEIGLASLGASDEDIEKLSTIYWFTIEMGLCRQNNQLKAYGAGLLSSYGELCHSMSTKPIVFPFDAKVTALQEYTDQDYQPVYYVTDSFDEAIANIREFASSLKKTFHCQYDLSSCSIEVIPRHREDDDKYELDLETQKKWSSMNGGKPSMVKHNDMESVTKLSKTIL